MKTKMAQEEMNVIVSQILDIALLVQEKQQSNQRPAVTNASYKPMPATNAQLVTNESATPETEIENVAASEYIKRMPAFNARYMKQR